MPRPNIRRAYCRRADMASAPSRKSRTRRRPRILAAEGASLLRCHAGTYACAATGHALELHRDCSGHLFAGVLAHLRGNKIAALTSTREISAADKTARGVREIDPALVWSMSRPTRG